MIASAYTYWRRPSFDRLSAVQLADGVERPESTPSALSFEALVRRESTSSGRRGLPPRRRRLARKAGLARGCRTRLERTFLQQARPQSDKTFLSDRTTRIAAFDDEPAPARAATLDRICERFATHVLSSRFELKQRVLRLSL